ncbi:MAG: cytochrome C [Ruminococcus sp.]|nr:cytochrome C [Ruminococcus sp.]
MKKTMTAKQIADYEQLCMDHANGRILTSDGLRLVCESNNLDPEAIGKHVLEVYTKFRTECVYDIQ